MSPLEPIFSVRYSYEIWDTAYRAVEGLEDRIFKLNLFPWPPSPWSDAQFLNNPANVHKRGYTEDSDFKYPAIWAAQAQAAKRKFSISGTEEISGQMEEVIGRCSTAVAALNVELLDKIAACLLTIGEDHSKSLEESLGEFITVSEQTQCKEKVKNVGWLDLFAWKIPALHPTKEGKSLAIGRCFWTIFNIKSIVGDIERKCPTEVMWSNRKRMIELAKLLRFNADA